MTGSVITRRYIGMALSPIHVGSRTRASALEAVDSSVARDLDGLPLIPATSLKGCARAYSFLDYGLQDCDGKGQECPQPHVCASCAVYGYASHHHGQGFTSLVRFTDGRILFAPIQTRSGMIWIASARRLIQSGIILSEAERDFLISCTKFPDTIAVSRSFAALAKDMNILIGSLVISSYSVTPIDTDEWLGPDDLRPVYERCVTLPEEVFGAFVSGSLTIHTSVAVDSATGSAKPGALFSVEAVPRSSVFTFELGYINPDRYGIGQFINEKGTVPAHLPGDLDSLIRIVESGLERLEILGVGGKRSRGFGRFKVWFISPSATGQPETGELHTDENARSRQVSRPKVFLSHSHKDKKFVRRLATDLQRRLIDVWLDEREILVGDSLHNRISEGVANADFLILMLSQASIRSGWVEREVNASLMEELERNRVIVLPILVDRLSKDQIPPLLRDRRYADFVSRYDEGFHELVYSIRGHWRSRKAATD